jgi:hypothetical protein
MGDSETPGRNEGAVNAVDGLAAAVASAENPGQIQRMMFSKGENTRHIRHEQMLDRWPILAEDWARMVEDTRLSAIDRTPGAATFGR